eukprot:RCo022506
MGSRVVLHVPRSGQSMLNKLSLFLGHIHPQGTFLGVLDVVCLVSGVGDGTQFVHIGCEPLDLDIPSGIPQGIAFSANHHSLALLLVQGCPQGVYVCHRGVPQSKFPGKTLQLVPILETDCGFVVSFSRTVMGSGIRVNETFRSCVRRNRRQHVGNLGTCDPLSRGGCRKGLLAKPLPLLDVLDDSGSCFIPGIKAVFLKNLALGCARGAFFNDKTAGIAQPVEKLSCLRFLHHNTVTDPRSYSGGIRTAFRLLQRMRTRPSINSQQLLRRLPRPMDQRIRKHRNSCPAHSSKIRCRLAQYPNL